jgi:hypothetical protein
MNRVAIINAATPYAVITTRCSGICCGVSPGSR